MSSSTCIVFDEKRCVNCKACEIHCRQWHGISLPLCRQLGGTPALKEGKVSLPMGFVTCVHCARPAFAPVRMMPCGWMRKTSSISMPTVVRAAGPA